MTTRWLAFIVAAAVAVGAGTWALRFFAPADSASARTNSVENSSSRTNPVDPIRSNQARLPSVYLPPATPIPGPVTTGDRFQLAGVVAPRDSVAGSQWVAMIAVNGEPPRAFSVGATVEGNIVLRDVSARGAIIGPRDGSVAMALEVLPAPATGMAQAPISGSAGNSHGSKYLELPLILPEPQSPADRAAEAGDGRWRPPTGQ